VLAGDCGSVVSTLRAARGAVPLLALFAAGCASETTGPSAVQPGVVAWMEWPTSVTAAAGGRIRVIGPNNYCGTLTFDVTAGPQQLAVAPDFRYDPPCPAVPGVVATSYDTLLPIPALDAGQGLPAASRVTAPVFDYPYSSLITRGFGFVQLDTVADPATMAGGQAVLLADSLGCAWARVAAWGPRQPPVYVVENPPDLGAAGTQVAFVGGHFVPASPARCGHASVLHLDVAEIAVTPP
jgi:hypothetical protein